MKQNLNLIKYWDDILVERHILKEIGYLKNYFPIQDFKSLNYIDIGANVGKFYDVLSRDYIIEGVIMVEPAPMLFEYLSKKFEFTHNCKLYNFAISDQTGVSKFHISEIENDTLENMNLGISRMLTNGKYEVDMIDAKYFLEEYVDDLESIDFIKIDTENQDYSILKSIQPIISKLNKKPFILFEHNYNSWMSEDDARKIIYDFTTVCGYETINFDNLIGDEFLRPKNR
jgi:FkbM family methyltransferase